jgi:hypothetical protein
MNIKNIWRNFLLSYCWLFLIPINSCHRICRDQINYVFQQTASFSPESDTISIGDTLFFHSSNSTVFTDIYSNQSIQFNGAINFGSALGIGGLVLGSDSIWGVVDHFDVVPLEGKIYSDNKLLPSKVKQLLYAERDGNYTLSFGLIPKIKGVYVLTLSDGIIFKPECKRANVVFTLLNNDHHLNYLQEMYYKKQAMPEIDKRSDYCFVVK